MSDKAELEHWRSVVPGMLETIHYHAHVGHDDPKDWRECGWCKRYMPLETATVDPRKALREWLDAKGHGARADLAAEIEVDGSTITYILNGRINPSDVVARAIERVTHIPASLWPTFNVNHRRSGAKRAKRLSDKLAPPPSPR